MIRRTLCSIALIIMAYIYGRHDAMNRPRELDTHQMTEILMHELTRPIGHAEIERRRKNP